MGRRGVLFLVICYLNGLLAHLNAGIITYDFSSTEYWVTESNGANHPGIGTSAKFSKIYYTKNNDCFVGKGEVYFNDNGFLMLNKGASLKIPYRDDWTITKVILHSHSTSTAAEVNIYSEYDTSLSTVQTWQQKDSDYEYVISSTVYRKLYVKTKSAAARITSVTIEYTSEKESDDPTYESSVLAPIFNPTSSSFSTESLTVAMDAAAGCEIYYTKDGSTPSYVSASEYNGEKGNAVAIYASESKVTLQAIAVDPATGKCSNVNSATYTYVQLTNDGSKTKPYTVAELRTKVNGESGKWLKGTICGAFDTNNNFVTSNITINSNIAIGDESEHVAMRLPQGSIRDGVNLKDHPYLLGKEILVKGDLDSYIVYKGIGVETPTDYEIFYDVPINSYGYATLYIDMPVSVPDGTTAYYCTIEDNYAELHPVGSIIPRDMGVIIESAPNTICTFTYTTNSNNKEGSIVEENLLVGFSKDTFVEADGYAYYALNVKDNQLGFYIPQTAVDKADAASGLTAKAHKAYLKILAEKNANMFIIHREGDETAIVPVEHISDNIIFDLQGRVVISPVSGVYIVGGRKIVIKH